MIWRKQTPPVEIVAGPKGFDDFEMKLGDILRGERATLGKSLLDVQRELHIRAAHLAAIENGDLDAFEAPSFVAGFVRSYARYLGLEPEWVWAQFCREHNFNVGANLGSGLGAPSPASPTPLRPRPEPVSGGLRAVGFLPDPDPFWRRIEPGALGSISVLVLLIGGLGFAAWTVLQEVQRVTVAPADLVPNVATDINPLSAVGSGGSVLAIDTDPLTSRPGTGAVGQVRIARPQALDVPVLTPRDGPIAAIPRAGAAVETTIATNDAVAEALAGLGLEPAQTSGSTQLARSGPQVMENGPPVVQILAVRPSWMRVRGADGSVVFERILDAGESYTLPATEVAPSLHAGNSGSVYFIVNGQAYGPSAPGANVVRNVPLGAEQIMASYQVADLSRDSDLAVHVARLREE